jgi:phosphoglycolate phosphatase
MQAMKPSPSGYLAAKRQFPLVQEEAWLSVGDSWIDGRASMEAGIPFIGYGGSPETLSHKGVQAVAHIQHLLELLAYV